MTKKRIADLLKEEVEKPKASEGRTRKRSSAKSTESDVAKTGASKPAARKTGAAAAKSTTKAKRTGSSKAETDALNKRIASLEAELSKANAQIEALQEDVETHQARVFELKDELEGAQGDRQKTAIALTKTTAELEDAKQTILKLTEAQEKKAKAQAKEESAAAEAEEKAEGKTGKKPEKKSLSVRQSRYSPYKAIPEYAIRRGAPASGQNNSMMSDDDIGWVD